MNRRTCLAFLAVGLTTPAITAGGSTPAMLGAPRYRLTWSPGTRQLRLAFTNRCTSTSARYVGHDIEAVIAGKNLLIKGRFQFERVGRISSADCMNRQSVEVVLDGVPPATYRIYHDGYDWSEVTLASDPVEEFYDPFHRPIYHGGLFTLP